MTPFNHSFTVMISIELFEVSPVDLPVDGVRSLVLVFNFLHIHNYLQNFGSFLWWVDGADIPFQVHGSVQLL